MTNALMAARDAVLSCHPARRVALNGRDWGLIDTGGPGEPVLFLPGTLGRADAFFARIEALAPHRRVLSVSHPASGGVREWAGDRAARLGGMGKVAVLGSSLGGYLAQYLARRIPGGSGISSPGTRFMRSRGRPCGCPMRWTCGRPPLPTCGRASGREWPPGRRRIPIMPTWWGCCRPRRTAASRKGNCAHGSTRSSRARRFPPIPGFPQR